MPPKKHQNSGGADGGGGGADNGGPPDSLHEINLRINQNTDESLESTRRMLAYCEEVLQKNQKKSKNKQNLHHNKKQKKNYYIKTKKDILNSK
jgi:hypothetical protein